MKIAEKLLVIDDNEKICKLIKNYASEFTDYSVDYAITSTAGIKLLENDYRLILLDIQLGEDDGFELITKIKDIYNGPIIFISAIKESDVVVSGLELGADDYIKKPFNLKELFLRVERSISRYEYNTPETNNQIQVADYVFDEVYNQIYKSGKKLKLSYVPSKILILLLKRANTTVSREEIFIEIWNQDKYSYSSRVIDTHIKSIRNETQDVRIKSVRGIGYTFEI